MTLHQPSVLECDQCGRTGMYFFRPRRAKEQATLDGWDIGKGDIADLCPFCAEAAREWHERYFIERYGI